MKAIQLYTAAVDNGGNRRDAADTLTVGKGDDQIDAARAKDLVDRQQAVDATPEGKGEK